MSVHRPGTHRSRGGLRHRLRLAGLVVLALAAGCAGAGSPTAVHSLSPSPRRGRPSVTPTGAPPASRLAGCPTPVVPVTSAAALSAALATAHPGSVIAVAAGTYTGNFSLAASGTPAARIVVCGPASAVLSGGNLASGYVLHLDGASWVRLDGLSLRDGQKGLVLDHSDHDVVTGTRVEDIGDEGVHLREFSSDDVLTGLAVSHTGLDDTKYGEGIYVGSANHNWCRYTHCQPDASNDDLIEDSVISDTTAENIDIKEGTTGGTVRGNHFNGTGMLASAATSWVNVKGNNWQILDNVGTDSIDDGLSVHQVYQGWGYHNTFAGNTLMVHGPGYGIYVQSHHLATLVSCDNTVVGAALGPWNVSCSG